MRTIGLYIYVNGEAKRIELFNDEMINITSAVQDVKDISKIFTDYSQSFTIPASKRNNAIFSHWYENSIDNDFDARIRKDAYIELDTIPFRSGKIQLEKASIKDGRIENYQITFFGSLISLKDAFNDRYLKDLDFSTYTFTYNGTNVSNKVKGNVNDHVKFPLITSKNVWQYNTGGTTVLNWDIKNTGTPIYTSELFPAMRVSEIFKVIATELGVTFSGSFLTNDRFTRAFLLLKNNDVFKIASIPKIINFTAVTATPSFRSAMFDVTGDEFLFDGGKCYDGSGVEVGSEYSNITSSNLGLQFTANGITYTLSIYFNGVKISDTDYITTTSPGFSIPIPLTSGAGSYSFYISSNTLINFTSSFTYNVYYDIYTNTVTASTTSTQTNSIDLDVATYMPDLKIEDFFSGILKAFNLTCYSENSGVYRIEQLEEWYNAGQIRDLSKYLITDNIELERVTTYKLISFNYQKSENFLSQNYKSRSVTEYGDLEYSLDIDGGEYKVQLPFENMLFQKFNGTDLQVGYSLKDDFSAYKPKPILLYDYGTLKTVSFYLHDGTNSNLTTTYNVFGQETNVSGTTYTINWGLETSSFTGNPEGNSLFEMYYKSYINNIFNKKSRLTRLKCILPISTITNLSLNDRIVIRDKRYLINSFSTELNTGLVSFELLPDFRIGASGSITTTTTIAPTTTTTTTSIPTNFTFEVAMYSDYRDVRYDASDSRLKSFEFRNGLGYTNIIATKLVSTNIIRNGTLHTYSITFGGPVAELKAITNYLTTSSISVIGSYNWELIHNGTVIGANSETTSAGIPNNTKYTLLTEVGIVTYLNSASVLRLNLGTAPTTTTTSTSSTSTTSTTTTSTSTTSTSSTSSTTTIIPPTCNLYFNFSDTAWYGNYIACNGTEMNGQFVYPYENICARTGTLTKLSGGLDLEIGIECGTTTTTSSTTSTSTTSTTTVTPCYQYFNFFGTSVIVDYQDCYGTWVYGYEVAGYGNICARVGTVTTVSGAGDLEIGGLCEV